MVLRPGQMRKILNQSSGLPETIFVFKLFCLILKCLFRAHILACHILLCQIQTAAASKCPVLFLKKTNTAVLFSLGNPYPNKYLVCTLNFTKLDKYTMVAFHFILYLWLSAFLYAFLYVHDHIWGFFVVIIVRWNKHSLLLQKPQMQYKL